MGEGWNRRIFVEYRNKLKIMFVNVIFSLESEKIGKLVIDSRVLQSVLSEFDIFHCNDWAAK